MKNKKVLLIVFGLLIGVSISFAYFVGRSLTSGSGASLTVKTATLNGTKIEVEGELFFNDGFIYPGHTEVSSIKVTAIGNNELIPYNLIWKGINSLYTSLNYKVYKSDSKIEVEANCEKKKEIRDGKQLLHEVCNILNESELGEEIYTGTIGRSEDTTKILLAEDEYITSTEKGKEVYYYVVIEYPNNEDIEENQNQDIGKEFSGEVTVEKSETNADINIMAVYVEDEEEKYQKSDTIPQSGYILDKVESHCDKGSTPIWDINNKGLLIKNLKESGTKCYLYFNKLSATNTLKSLNLQVSDSDCLTIDESTGLPISEITGIETGDLLCEGQDDYGKTYYFRGTGTHNWVKIDNTYWRIIRINGNGTIRLIYNGTSNAATGVSTMAFNGTNKKYNNSYGDNAYVGFMYGATSASTYAATHTNTTPSNILTELKTWWTGSDFPAEYKKYVDGVTGFCNDRESYSSTASSSKTTSGVGFGTKTTYYGSYIRVITDKKPSFKCPQMSQDLFTTSDNEKGNKALSSVSGAEVPVGLITADEVMYAGGMNDSNNIGYYLYNGIEYWTMSPYEYYYYISSSQYAYVFRVDNAGRFNNANVNSTNIGVRPVINLKSDTPFADSTGNGEWGSSTNPFVVQLD